MLGDLITAAEAYRIGLINWVVPRDQLASEARRIAVRLARMPTETMQLTKRALNNSLEIMGFRASSEWGIDQFFLSEMFMTKQKAEFMRIVEEQGVKAATRWAEEYYK